MKLILTRHGETIENVQKISQGHMPGTLNKKGLDQAKRLARRLKYEQFDAIYSSDLARSADTTKIISKFHKDVPIFYVKGLREGDLGRFAGRPGSEIDWDNRPADIETKETMDKRSKKVLDSAFEKYPQGSVLFVGHNGINKSLIRVIKGLKSEEKIENLANTSVCVFEIREDKNHKVHLMNCTKHLDD